MPYFKVVGRSNRFGSNAMIYLGPEPSRNTLSSLKSIMEHERYRDWLPTYEKGKTIMKAPGSIGILVFSSREDAQNFLEKRWEVKAMQIIEVEGIGEPHHVDKIITGGGALEHLPLPNDPNLQEFSYVDPPKGTVAFDSVLVLE